MTITADDLRVLDPVSVEEEGETSETPETPETTESVQETSEETATSADESVAEAEGKTLETSESPESAYVKELAEMRQYMTELAKANSELKNEMAKISSASKVNLQPATPTLPQIEAAVFYDADGNEVKAVPADAVEKYLKNTLSTQQPQPEASQETEYDQAIAEYNKVVAAKAPVLDTLKEVMKANPAYADIDAVVTPANANALYNRLAQAHIAKSGGDLGTVLLQIQSAVLAEKNPYDFLYKNIKAMIAPAKKSTAAPSPQKVPNTLATTGDTTKSGWTASKIDAMDELSPEYAAIPSGVKEKYLAGELK